MSAQVLLADSSIEVGTHPTATVFGMTINLDTVWSTAIAAAIVIGLGLWVRAKVTSKVPNKPQLLLETIFAWARDQVKDNIGAEAPGYVLPLAFTLFVFILVSNWLSILPAQAGGKDFVPPPTFDPNLTYAMMILVFVWVWVAGFRRHGLGYLGHVAKGPGNKAFLAPINIIVEVIANPIALALRLFGNIFAGTIMVAVIGLLPFYIAWAPLAGWKLFDMAIGLIQAFVFALLTIIYFSQTLESHAEEAH
ncbi:MAG TPA: F0F1 ATP synthase subunit A [Pseudonocardiaceae bacterium]|jgi:F-type H+-transporting ATPase subunit a|nr:F0F1 ATP synthase subunit A [Pseudonocardiaceae bacterium]